MKQLLTILGSTGSIGVSTLDVIARHPEKFAVYALTGHHRIKQLAEQCIRFQPKFAVVADAEGAKELTQLLQAASCKTEILHGAQALIDVASAEAVHSVMAAIVGAAGLPPALAAAQHGKTIYLANKETLVVSGSLFMETAKRCGATILPVDSEHNAIFQVLPYGFEAGKLTENGIHSIILTASGGPFLDTDLKDFPDITPAQAVKHPNWSMGQKISVDSATMMNKGLELIEAHWLFGAAPDALEVVIHPQSIIHSMVRYLDGSVLAQLGSPDMRIPIANCLGLPERITSGAAALDFFQLGNLNFRQPEWERFPCLALAYRAMRMGGFAPCVLNAANEVAVAAFLDKRIRFTDIATLVEHVLAHTPSGSPYHLDDLLQADEAARQQAEAHIHKIGH